MLYPWTDFFQLGVVVSAFYPEVRQRKGPILEITRKLAADPFFQALEFSGAEDPAVQKELIPVTRASGKSLVFAGASYCYLGQHNLHSAPRPDPRKNFRGRQRGFPPGLGEI